MVRDVGACKQVDQSCQSEPLQPGACPLDEVESAPAADLQLQFAVQQEVERQAPSWQDKIVQKVLKTLDQRDRADWQSSANIPSKSRPK